MQQDYRKCKRFFSFFQKNYSKKEHEDFIQGKGLIYNKQSKAYIERVFLYTWVFDMCGVFGVYIGNTVAFGSAEASSDIDLFIITHERYLWGTRLLITLFFHVLGIRRHGKHVAGRMCLSFYATRHGAFNLASVSLPFDPYLAFWTSSLVPVFSRNSLSLAFSQSQLWLDVYGLSRPMVCEIEHASLRWWQHAVLFISEIMAQCLYRPLTWIRYLFQGKPFGIILSRSMLKFHRHDTRKYHAKRMMEE